MTYNVDMYFLSSLTVRFLSWFIRTFKLGNGYTWPGHFVLKVFPNIWKSSKLHFGKGVVLISGTNGKTTTAKLVSHLLGFAGYSVTTNASGANLTNGILTSILLRAGFFCGVRDDFAVFEVDELHLPFALQSMFPTHLVLTNLSRDQLDRYGEIDTILSCWESALCSIDLNLKIFLDVEATNLLPLREHFPTENISFYGSSLDLLEKTALVGSFNAKNVNSAVLMAKEFGLNPSQIDQGLQSFEPAFGRGEILSKIGKTFYIFLAKNPASFNNNLNLLKGNFPDFDSILFLLNDKIPDGRDVSWIYDIDPVLLHEVCANKRVFVGGSRGLDMEIRLNYAHVTDIVGDFGATFTRERFSKAEGEKVVVLPNYSSMLEFRRILLGKNIL